MKLLAILLVMTSCTLPRVERSHSVIDKTERCMLRLVEKNGVSATEAESVCSQIHRNSIHLRIIEKK